VPKHHFDPPRGRFEEFMVDAPELLANALGDPTQRNVVVYLPPGYDTSNAEYPLFVDLAAFSSSGPRRIAWTAFGASVPQRVDRLVECGEMGPVILAFPDCFTSLGGNQYVDSPIVGRWESYIRQAVVPALEARFRIRHDARAVYGKSSGGYGALRQGLLHGEEWAAVACHSGDIGFDILFRRELPGALDTLTRFRGDAAAFFDDFWSKPKVRSADLHVAMILAMCASYAPDLTARLGIRLPVDPQTCELHPEVWARWMDHDPLSLLDTPSHQANLRRLRALYFDCGRFDPYFLHYGARAFARKLAGLNIPHVHEEFDDDHSSIDYRLDRSLPLLYRAVTPAVATGSDGERRT